MGYGHVHSSIGFKYGLMNVFRDSMADGEKSCSEELILLVVGIAVKVGSPSKNVGGFFNAIPLWV